MNLNVFGWNNARETEISQYKNCGMIPGRVISASRGIYGIITPEGEMRGEISGSFRYKTVSNLEYPVVGDYVLVREYEGISIIEFVLQRKTLLKRKAPGVSAEEQVLAANVDYVFIVFGLDGGRSFNLRTMERLLTLVWDSGASPVVVLNKADLCENSNERKTKQCEMPRVYR